MGWFENAALVTTFNLEIGITGAILTKLDGDSRGGAALSVKEVWMLIKFMHKVFLFKESLLLLFIFMRHLHAKFPSKFDGISFQDVPYLLHFT